MPALEEELLVWRDRVLKEAPPPGLLDWTYRLPCGCCYVPAALLGRRCDQHGAGIFGFELDGTITKAVGPYPKRFVPLREAEKDDQCRS